MVANTHETTSIAPAVSEVQKESFSVVDDRIIRRVGGSECLIEASIATPNRSVTDPKGDWWKAYLAGAVPQPAKLQDHQISAVDLFCGPGGLALGLRQLALEMGVEVVSEAIADQDEGAVRVYAANHDTRTKTTKSVSSLVDYGIRGRSENAEYLYPPELLEESWASLHRRIDIVLAGPPCQGHSNLNNRSRRDDRRNELYLTVPSIAVALSAPIVVIENVPAVIHDWSQVVQTAQALLESEGYTVTTHVINAATLGWPQNRSRHFLVARRDVAPLSLAAVTASLSEPQPRSVWWAIGDIANLKSDDPMDQVTELSAENQRRIEWLFENDQYELALSERPDSHKEGTTYTSVYGRMRVGEAAPTITTGFMSPGRGRYVHPTQQRVLTAREAARVQGFPDSYSFVVDRRHPPARNKLAKWIGDAVPMPLGYAACLAALGPGLPNRIMATRKARETAVALED